MNLAIGLTQWEDVPSASDFSSALLSKTYVCSENVSRRKNPSAAASCEISQVEE